VSSLEQKDTYSRMLRKQTNSPDLVLLLLLYTPVGNERDVAIDQVVLDSQICLMVGHDMVVVPGKSCSISSLILSFLLTACSVCVGVDCTLRTA